MSRFPAVWPTPEQHIHAVTPARPVMYFSPSKLTSVLRRYHVGFPGVVTYAVKANDERIVLENLVASGLATFDVASPNEMVLVRDVLPTATLHYNNPVRSRDEIATAVALGVASYSVDCQSELTKLVDGGVPKDCEIAVRLKLPVSGASYDFGDKFGAHPETCVDLLKRVEDLGLTPSMTFHPGTQCADPEAWVSYIRVVVEIAEKAGVKLSRLNVGGGFAARRVGDAPDLEAIFNAIDVAVKLGFGDDAPKLLCEPGRAMVADCMTLGCQVKAVLEDGSVFLNDGIYGTLGELPSIGMTDRLKLVSPQGSARKGALVKREVFGPTCDSLDRIPGEVPLPGDIQEGDYLLVGGVGAYSTATRTFFNGYGHFDVITVEQSL